MKRRESGAAILDELDAAPERQPRARVDPFAGLSARERAQAGQSLHLRRMLTEQRARKGRAEVSPAALARSRRRPARSETLT